MIQQSVALRPGVPADTPGLAMLERGVFTHDLIGKRSFERMLAHGRNTLIVADREGVVVGYVLLLRRRGSLRGRIYSLARAAQAPAGTGRRLLEAALREARALGLRLVALEVKESNAPARHLYQSLGFRVAARVENYYSDGAPALRMRLILAERPEIPS